MKKLISKIYSNLTKRVALSLLTLLLALSYFIRYEHFNNTTGSANLEASYHTLLTIRALKESPISNHYFLPTVTLGKDNDKFISWGSTLPTKTGDYVYTSFTPPGFIIPYLVFTILDLDITLKNLAYFNFVLNVIFSFLLFNFLLLILNNNNSNNKNSIFAALLGTIISVFSTESLISFGVVYWVHSLNQIFILFALYQFARYVISQQPATSNQQPATSNQQPATSNQQPATSNF